MTPEHELLSLIMQTGNLQEALDWGVEPDDFTGFDTKPVYDRLLSIHTDPHSHGAVIGPQLALQSYFPNWKFHADPGSTIQQLCKEVRKGRLTRILKAAADAAIQEADYDVVDAYRNLERVVELYRNLGATKKVDVMQGDGYRRVLQRYNRVISGGRIGMASWPWPLLESESGGLAKDEFAIFYGRPKSMKTWVLCYLIWWFSVVQGLRVLVYTKEMTMDDIYQRLAALELEVAYQDLRHGRLTQEQYNVFCALVQQYGSLSDSPVIGLSAKDVDGRDTPGWLRAKIRKYKPDLVAIDGIYKMSPENKKLSKDNERVRSIICDVRQIILDEGVPCLATSQANRAAAKNEQANLDEMAFSDAAGQEATMMCRVIKNEAKQELSIVIGGSREWHLAGFKTKGIPATNFSEVGPLSSGEALRAQAEDAEEELKEVSAPSNKRKKEPGLDPAPIVKRATKGLVGG